MIKLIDRLKKEYFELNDKIAHLDIFIGSYCKDIKIHEKYLEMLNEQLDIMMEYREILYKRICYLIEETKEK